MKYFSPSEDFLQVCKIRLRVFPRVRYSSIVCSLISKAKHSLAKWIMKIKEQITFQHRHGLRAGEKDRGRQTSAAGEMTESQSEK